MKSLIAATLCLVSTVVSAAGAPYVSVWEFSKDNSELILPLPNVMSIVLRLIGAMVRKAKLQLMMTLMLAIFMLNLASIRLRFQV